MPVTRAYELGRILGRGAIGAVREAVHRPTGRRVAIKSLSMSCAGARARRSLLDEATAAAQLRHPNVVELVDITEDDDGTPMLVMELVAGHDLERWVERWPGWSDARAAFGDVLTGLAAAHAEGIVHRDLKPANLLRGPDGVVKIADFGLARVLDPLGRGLTDVGVEGTPAYMAPEQFDAPREVGPWTDLYAFGVILHELLAGELPFPVASPLSTWETKRAGVLRPLRPRPGVEVPRDLLGLVRRLLDPDARARPRFARRVRDELLGVCPSSSVASRSPAGPRPAAATLLDGSATGPVPSLGAATQTRLDPRASVGRASSFLRLQRTSLVGRGEERALITRRVVDTVERGGARAVVLLGAAGVGKSRLARWGMQHVEGEALMESVAVGFDVAGLEAGAGLRAAVRRLIGPPAPPAAAAAPDRRPWAWLWADGRPPFDVERMAEWVEGAPDASPAPRADAAALAHDALRAVTRRVPLFLWLDDLAWARDGTLELVERLLETQDSSVLVVATMRDSVLDHPTLGPALAPLLARPTVTVRRLGPLDVAERAALLSELAPLSPGLSDALAQRVDRTPLVLVQLVSEWLGTGLLVERDGCFEPAVGDVDALLEACPVRSVLSQRIEAVLRSLGAASPGAEGVLLRAAVLGYRFEARTLEACVADDPVLAAQLDPVLDRLLLDGLLRPEPPAMYRFEHELLREALVERLRGRADRREVCESAARALLSVHGRVRWDTMRRAAELLRDAGRLDEAYGLLAETATASARTGDLGHAREQGSEIDRWLERDGGGSDLHVSVALRARSSIAYHALDYERALELCRRSQRAALRARAPDHVALGRSLESAILRYVDRFDEAERAIEDVRAFAGAHRDAADPATRKTARELLLVAAWHAAELAGLRDDVSTGRRIFEDAWTAGRDSLTPYRRSIAAMELGEWRLVDGDLDGAMQMAALARDIIARTGDDISPHDLAHHEAQLASWRGRHAEARRHLPGLIERARSLGDTWRTTLLLLVDAAAAVELDGVIERREAVGRFLSAYAEVPRDEPFSRRTMERLAARLREVGEPDLAQRVDALRAAREAEVARAFRS